MDELHSAPAGSAANDASLLARARRGPDDSPFDYVIVGAGAGGGPLAARLALAGKRVLLLDAGRDPALAKEGNAEPGEVFAVPGYHAAATEASQQSWQFSVRHYADEARQAADEKYVPERDPAANGGAGEGGIFYPRAAALGGCTAHHAMIVAVPNDRDWNYIADLTGDDSWRAPHMQGYFARLERNRYLEDYNRWLKRLLGWLYVLWQRVVLLFHPRAVLDEGGHGKHGWQPTRFIDPALIEGISARDRGFTSVLIGSALAVLHSDNRLLAMLKRSLVWLRVVQHIDPNDLNTRRTSPEGAFLIPSGIESGDAVDFQRVPLRGRRTGVREFLLQTRADHPDRLVIETDVHVTRVLFAPPRFDTPPRAIGVELAPGPHLYEASPLRRADSGERVRYFSRGEVILCGGAFNTPQLLMLSGIGDASKLAAMPDGAACVLRGADGAPLAGGAPIRIDLPGVGRNLQDRYEVSVVSELDAEFATLQNVSFTPGDPNDPIRREWFRNHRGLYATNGGTLAVLRRSSALGTNEPEPDLFAFGAPAAFRGYYWGWSRELLRRTLGAGEDQRNLWSWIILKAYTRNDGGCVRLRSADPFVQPDVCFDSFNEAAEARAKRIAALIAARVAAGRPVPKRLAHAEALTRKVLADSERDLEALVDAVGFMREINARNPRRFTREVQPGPDLPDGSAALKEWIRTQAWGHHASCTCRMGSDRWQADPLALRDRFAVVDSRFRVHGVEGLRIVDASVFPKIPGYFILTPILMISEKASDVLLEEAGDTVYAPGFECAEAAAVHARRAIARPTVREPDPDMAADERAVCEEAGAADTRCAGDPERLPRDTVGIALSGGGVRSATFALGVLQALARRDRLRDVDFLSTVSGGGFAGSFLGRLFTRDLVRQSMDPVGRVQDTLTDQRSGPLWWLRTQANYLFANGSADLRQSLAVLWRNILSLHVVMGALCFATFGALIWIARTALPPPPALDGVVVSPWWWLPIAALGLGVLPATAAFWLSPKSGSYRPYPVFALLAWVVMLGGALWLLQIPGALLYSGAALVTVLLSWAWQHVARWGTVPGRELAAAEQRFRALAARRLVTEKHEDDLFRKQEETRQQIGTIVRNRLTRGLGEVVAIFAALIGFVVLDTLALSYGADMPAPALGAMLVAVGPLLPLLRRVGLDALRQVSSDGKEGISLVRTAKLLGIPLAIFLLWVVDTLAHRLFAHHPHAAIWVVLVAAAFSAAIGRAFDFLNLSALRATYAARLARTYLGASNEERVFGAASDESRDVEQAHPKDDLPHDQYHPEHHGGPLHLINVCINETVDLASEREVRERKGIPMCVTPHGVVVGRRYFAEWTVPDALPRWQKRRRWRDGLDADDDRPLAKRRRTALQSLPVSSDPNAFHVLKTRDSDSVEVEPLTLATWTAISGAAFNTGTGRSTSLPLSLFMGLANVRLGYWWDTGALAHERPGRYPLPIWRKLKRLPSQVFGVQSMLLAELRGRFRGPSEWFWYLSDGGHFDVTGLYELLRRRVRFMIVCDAGEDADYRFDDLGLLARQARMDFGADIDWKPTQLPPWLTAWVDPAALAPIDAIGRTGPRHAAVARVTWDRGDDESWILLLKPGVDDDLSQDVRNYAAQHPAFPQQSTFDQVFDDNQWESYRALGEQLALRVVR